MPPRHASDPDEHESPRYDPDEGEALPAQRPWRARALLVLCPAFVAAGVLEMLVFAWVDPDTLNGIHAESGAPWPRIAVYSLAFLAFWLIVSASTAVTLWLGAARADLRQRKLP
jgi:hypothetical protein